MDRYPPIVGHGLVGYLVMPAATLDQALDADQGR